MSSQNSSIQVSVIMPTYNQAAFISRSIKSILLQSFKNWELIIINDGSTDCTEDMIGDHLSDKRIRYLKNQRNRGLGYSLNQGLQIASAEYIAYLPSDDIFFAGHIQKLWTTLASNHDCSLAFSGMLYCDANNGLASQPRDVFVAAGGWFQLVQVMHRKTTALWLERAELVTDDLGRMFWNKFLNGEAALSTESVTCEWVQHPEQRHRLLNETMSGGIYAYKRFYEVDQPLRFHSSVGNFIDEVSLYGRFRNQRNRIPESGRRCLKILLVGELAYNAERICALEEYGHKLYGLWILNPEFYNTIGPLPFGNVEDIPLENWKERIDEIRPDIIYALLNFQVIPLAHYILSSNPGIPFVWHFKEGPFISRQNGLWKQLMELYTNSDGQIFINNETKKWYEQFITFKTPTLILDGDLPKQDWFIREKRDLLSDTDGEIHTVIPGRPFGIGSVELASLKEQQIHLHFYGEFFHTTWAAWVRNAQECAPGYIHIHGNCTPNRWAAEFSQYDAGWLHVFESANNGELMKVNWNDLNYPARMSTLAAAGLPMILKSNPGHLVATENMLIRLQNGILFKDFYRLRNAFGDNAQRKRIRENAWNTRLLFSFDHYLDDLTAFFYEVIEHYHKAKSR